MFFFVSLKDLKKSLQDAGETVIQLSLDTVDAETPSAVVTTGDAQPGPSLSVEDGSEPALQTTPSEFPSSPSSACASEDAHMEVDSVKAEAEVPTEAAVVPEDIKDRGEATADDEPAVVSGNTCQAPSAAEPLPEENSGQLEINEEIFQALKAAVDECRIILASRAQHENNTVQTHLGL